MNLSWFDDWRFDMRGSTAFRDNRTLAANGAAVRPIAGKLPQGLHMAQGNAIEVGAGLPAMG
ncbi:hypothetical protein [Pseudomonas inefficax]|uniref:hypothetical protein n=1 Tax=Pseudomonas inefficax TaxID=2078786 RepID=UPI0010632D6F|nr:hypothetical protein [Pseudomonas inefficax]